MLPWPFNYVVWKSLAANDLISANEQFAQKLRINIGFYEKERFFHLAVVLLLLLLGLFFEKEEMEEEGHC